MPYIKIRTKILLGMTGIIVLGGLLTIFLISHMTFRILLKESEKREVFMAQQTAHESASLILTENYVGLQLLLESHFTEQDVAYAFVLDKRGNILAHSFGPSFPIELKHANAVPSGSPYHFAKLETDQGTILDVAAPIMEGRLGTLRIGLSEKGIKQNVREIVAALFWTRILIIVIGFFAVFFFVNWVMRPFKELMKGVQIIRTGDFSYRVPVLSNDEIGELSTALNGAIEELSRITVSQDELIKEIVERKKVEEALRASENKYRTMVEATGTGYLILDGQGRVMDANMEYVRLTGYERLRDILGRSVVEWTAADKRAQNAEAVAWCIKNRSIKNFVTEYQGKKGVRIPVEIDATVEGEGESLRVISLCRDITERRKMEEEKRDLLKQEAVVETKSRFASMVSHELRSPLAVIRGAVEVILEGLVGSVSEEQKELLEGAKKTSERLGRLINNVLDFQKIEAGKMEFEIAANDLNEVMHEVSGSMGVLLKKKGLHLTLDLVEDLPLIRFDRDRIVQVVMNLMSNAVKYTDKGGITLRTRKEKDKVTVSVQDTGMGIGAESMGKLFEAFQQVDSIRDKEKGGTGLGLAICKEIITAHGGTIWAESEPGHGSVFNFTLPL